MDTKMVGDIRCFQYVVTATISFVIYDAWLTFPAESHFIWRRPVTLTRALYVLNRGLGLASLAAMLYFTTRPLSPMGCTIYSIVQNYTNMFLALPGDGLILWRVLALFQQRRLVRLLVLSFYAVVRTTDLIIIILYTRQNVVISPPEVPGCWSALDWEKIDSFLSLFLIPTGFILQSVLILLSLFNPHTLRKRGQTPIKPLLRILQTEIAIYFAVWLAVLVINAVSEAATQGRPVLGAVGIPISIGFETLAPCRLYLHLKSTQSADQEDVSDEKNPPGSTALSSGEPDRGHNTVSTWSSARSASRIGRSSLSHRSLWVAPETGGQLADEERSHKDAMEVVTILAEAGQS